MALTMTSSSQAIFYEKVFGPSHDVTQMVKKMIALGVTFETTLYECKAVYHGVKFAVALTKGTSSLMKDSVSPVFVQQNKDLIAKWLMDVKNQMVSVAVPVPSVATAPPQHTVVLTAYAGNIIVLIKIIRQITGFQLAQAKALAEGVMHGVPVNLIVFTTHEEAEAALLKLAAIGAQAKIQSSVTGMKYSVGTFDESVHKATAAVEGFTKAMGTPKPVPAVVPLREAQAIGQKVKGTSQGSVYYCVAVGQHVRVAARIHKGGTISIRAEWEGTPTADLKKLQESGLQLKSNYGSMHLDAQGVPAGKVVGAFVLGTGIEWEQLIMSSTKLVVENA